MAPVLQLSNDLLKLMSDCDYIAREQHTETDRRRRVGMFARNKRRCWWNEDRSKIWHAWRMIGWRWQQAALRLWAAVALSVRAPAHLAKLQQQQQQRCHSDVTRCRLPSGDKFTAQVTTWYAPSCSMRPSLRSSWHIYIWEY